jgi:7-cyano-7-deazaguanine synthase
MQLELDFNKGKHVVLSLSGGMDSSTLLLRCLKEYDTVTAISFDYGQKHRVELDRAQSLVDHLCNGDIGISNTLRYRQIKLDGLSDLLDSTLVVGGDEVPEGHYEEDNMKATVVPNRNKIFSSIVQAVALSVVSRTGETCDIALGIHAGDHDIYPDCRQEFRDADMEAFRLGNWDAKKVNFFTPYLEGDKFTILQDGEVLCRELGLDFDEVYSRTMTSYKPISIVTKEKPLQTYNDGIPVNTTGEAFIERWYSDYKSASSVERVEAFIALGRPDPAPYADETGPVSWDTAKMYVHNIITNHAKKQKIK